MRRKLVKVAVALVAAGLPVLASAQPATAGQVHGCPARHICLYADGQFGGAMQAISGYAQYSDLGAAVNSKASSWVSTTQRQTMCVYRNHRNWRGQWVRDTLHRVEPGKQVPVVPYKTNDRANAVGWC